MEKPILAIIAPCYNEEEILQESFEKLSSVLNDLKSSEKISEESYISFVDDGSCDKTWDIIKTLDVKGIKLSKNFGQQKALYAGLVENNADIYITLDADLQDDIAIIEQMIDKYKEGYELVFGARNNRSTDTFLKKTFSDIYYTLIKHLGINSISHHAEFRLISKKIVELLKQTPETNLYLRGLISDFGFKSTVLYHSRKKRIGGSPKYNIYQSTQLAIEGITSFSTTPLRFISFLGLLCFAIAILMTIYGIYSWTINKVITGWTSLFISLYFIGGIQLLSVGIIGEYIGKIYKETKHRPRYIIEEKTNE